MRNPDLPKLLRARRDVMQSEGLQVIYEQAAIELDKLEKIYVEMENDPPDRGRIKEILNGD